MDEQTSLIAAHPKGESDLQVLDALAELIKVDTYSGVVHVDLCPGAPVTALGQLVFYVDFLKTSGLFESWVEGCPLDQISPNAHDKIDILGTIMLSVLNGHTRYSHVTALRSDGVNPGLLGMTEVVSEDSARKAFRAVDSTAAEAWMSKHLEACYAPLLQESWVLDIDTRVKTIYGKQEGAEVGYNPHKPGRPSHTYHTYFISRIRLILDVEVQPGKKTASCYTMPRLWRYLDGISPSAWPSLIRGDCAFGNEGVMVEAEKRQLNYLFKLRQTSGVKKLINRLFHHDDWSFADKGWEGVSASLKLSGWTRERRVVVLRRKVHSAVVLRPGGQTELVFTQDLNGTTYEYAVLVTNLGLSIALMAQGYRDRADAENVFDELVNQWGWCGFTTRDLLRCNLMARIIALIYNWWSLFVRLAIPDRHAEAVTSRPLLLHGVARKTHSGGQTTLHITSTHSKANQASMVLASICALLRAFRATTEQLPREERWRLLLSRIFAQFIDGRPLQHPPAQINGP